MTGLIEADKVRFVTNLADNGEILMDTTDKKSLAIEGLRVGLKAFIITYILAFVIAVVVNLSVIENIQDYLQGTLVEGVGFNFGLVIKTTALLMNISVFNSSGVIKIGLLVLVVLPFFAFYMADRSDNKESGMGFAGFIIYGIASLVFTVLLTLLSVISKGEFFDVAVDFVSLRNVFMTFIITYLIQISIGMNYDVHRLPGVIATRWMVRLVLGFAVLASIAGLVYGMTRFTTNPMLILFGLLVLVPNVAIYLMFMMMGISVDFNTELQQLMNYGEIDLSYAAIPMGVRIALMAIFIASIFISLYKMDHDIYMKSIVGFAVTFPLICLLAALCTTVNLGEVKFIGSIHFGISYLEALLYPVVAILGMAVFDLAVKQMFKVIRD